MCTAAAAAADHLLLLLQLPPLAREWHTLRLCNQPPAPHVNGIKCFCCFCFYYFCSKLLLSLAALGK
jgi:hypothetical protein